MFKEISAKEINDNLIKAISEEWMLVAAGDREKYNMMTVVRPQRYTMEFINNSDYFTLSFYGDNKDIHKVCGSKSGRDTDKTALTGLTPVFSDNTVYFEQARMVIICKKQYVGQMKADCFTDKEPLRWYNDDFHYMIIGKIEKVLVKE